MRPKLSLVSTSTARTTAAGDRNLDDAARGAPERPSRVVAHEAVSRAVAIIDAARAEREDRIDAAGIQIHVIASVPEMAVKHESVERSVGTLLDVALAAAPRGGVVDLVARERESVVIAVSYAAAPSAELRRRARRLLPGGRGLFEVSPSALAAFDSWRRRVEREGGAVVVDGDAQRTTIVVNLPIERSAVSDVDAAMRVLCA